MTSEATVRVRADAPDRTASEAILATFVGTDVARSTWAGWLWSNAHFVRVVEWSYPTSTVTVRNLLFAGDSSWLVLFAVPPVFLIVAGALAARRAPVGTVAELPAFRIKLPAAAVRGMGVWVGYLPLTVLGTFLFSVPTDHATLAPFAPSLVGAIVIAGFAYPVIFGGIGGWLGAQRRSRSGRAEADGPSRSTG